jgi:invasion protein IalB
MRRSAALLAAALLAPAASLALAQEPTVTRSERFGAWGYSCATAQHDGRPVERCMISQIVATDPARQKVVLGLTVDFADSATVPTLRARFSSKAERRAGIGLKIDARPDMRLPIGDCDSRRCEAVGRLSPPVLAQWRKGKRAQFAFLQQNGKQQVFPVSLDGFGQALEALRRHPGLSG